jgi:hypothetical protein
VALLLQLAVNNLACVTVHAAVFLLEKGLRVMVLVNKVHVVVGQDQGAGRNTAAACNWRQWHGQCVHEAVGEGALIGLPGLLWMCVQEFTRNVRREVAKLKLLLQQYAVMSTQVRKLTLWLQIHSMKFACSFDPGCAFNAERNVQHSMQWGQGGVIRHVMHRA